MAKKLSRNAPCPCGSAKKYKHCCLGKDVEWVESGDGHIIRRGQIPDDVVEMLDEVDGVSMAEIVADNVLWSDPDLLDDLEEDMSDEERKAWQQAMEELVQSGVMMKLKVAAMKEAQVHPALIYATEKLNGLAANESNREQMTDEERVQWNAAIDEYEAEHGVKVIRRTLTENELDAIIELLNPDNL